MFKYCPSCASKNINFDGKNCSSCPDCSSVFYQNVAAANGCLIIVPESDSVEDQSDNLHGKKSDRFVFLVRGREPGAGKLDLPGGFVDIGEGILEGLRRELQEEIGWTPPMPEGSNLSDIFRLFASFSNVYEYKSIKYNTCDMYFSVKAPGLKLKDLTMEKAEIAEIRFLKPDEIDFSEFAFESTRQAVKTYLNLS